MHILLKVKSFFTFWMDFIYEELSVHHRIEVWFTLNQDIHTSSWTLVALFTILKQSGILNIASSHREIDLNTSLITDFLNLFIVFPRMLMFSNFPCSWQPIHENEANDHFSQRWMFLQWKRFRWIFSACDTHTSIRLENLLCMVFISFHTSVHQKMKNIWFCRLSIRIEEQVSYLWSYFESILNRFLTHLHRFFVFMLMNSQVVG